MTHRGAILGGIIITINFELGQSSNSNLMNVRHEVIGDTPWIFPNLPTLVSPNRIEVPQQNDSPISLCSLNVSGNFFNKELHTHTNIVNVKFFHLKFNQSIYSVLPWFFRRDSWRANASPPPRMELDGVGRKQWRRRK